MKLESNKDISFIIKPFLILSFSIVFLVGVLSFGLRKIGDLRTRIKDLEAGQKTLLAKVNVLRNATDTIPEDLTFINMALPSKGAVIYGLSQIKNQAVSSGLTLSNVKAGNVIVGTNGVSKVSINFDAEGEENSIITYLNSLTKSLPIMKIEKVKLDQTSGVSRASVTVNVYTAELPKKIPSLSSPITDLTAQELETLNELTSYNAPTFTEPLPVDTGGKEDPFN